VTANYTVLGSERRFDGHVISLRSDELTMPGGGTSVRDVVEHPGAVAVVALDDEGGVVLVEQYRHPVRERLWELPAGLLDVEGESALVAAQRELQEETGLRAGIWHVLVDMLTSPGMTDEGIRIFLAEDLVAVEQPAGENEEAEMRVDRVPLDAAVAHVLSGAIRNGAACAGLLAAAAVSGAGRIRLRAADAPWTDRPDRAPSDG
jgi:8-oxo-dGTP pyrophosphatase MutT (NUDIX family)